MAWRHRWLFWSFTRRELHSRYTGSIAGAGWAVLHPLAMLAVFAFVFTSVFRVTLPVEAGSRSYVAFLAVTLWPWLMFSEGLTRGMGSIRANEGLIRKVAFPHRLVVYAAVVSTFVVHLAGYAAVLVAIHFLVQPVAFASLPAALVILAFVGLAATGLAAFLAAVQTLLRDAEQVTTVVLTLLFHATPILYPLALVPPSFQRYVAMNPLAPVAERLREIVLQGSGLVASDLWIGVVALAIFAGGLWFFERLSPFFEDFL